jgi:hypothetical protein
MIQPLAMMRDITVGCQDPIVCPRYIAVNGKCLYIHEGCCLIYESLERPLRTMVE